MNKLQTVPKWIIAYLWIITIITFMLSMLAYINPAIQFPGFAEIGALSLAGPLGFFVARNVATGVTTAFALINGTVNALMTAFVLRAVTDGMDFVHSVIVGNFPLAIFAFALCAIEIIALIKLKKLN